MKKLTFLVVACFMAVFAYGQDGIVYWSAADGYKFDFDLDGKVDLTIPTQTKDIPIAEVFVFDANGDGHFDLCEVDRSGSVDLLIHWRFYYNDGNNNFVDPQDIIYGMAVGDKSLAGEFNGDAVGDVAIRRDNEWGLWWLMHFQAMAPDVNINFGIADDDCLLAGDMNHDGQGDVVLYNKGAWMSSFTPSTSEYKTPDFAVQDIVNMQFGTKNDIPVLLDVDGDGYDDMALCSVNDEEVNVNLHSADKTENHGYSKSGRGSFDKTFYMPAGLKPTCVRGVKYVKGSNINNVSTGNLVSVYPSVVARGTSFTVNASAADAKVSVYNVTGQLFETAVASEDGKVIINTGNLERGNYYVKVETGNGITTKKALVF